ncbi:uncharacterized protein TRUGW13939_02540 [Talaromyces rugulosus]|uniref:Uncharacterized protein n=1 Tax=Talaromyces rugulosus TaxID=121627 RepID=A0A7H8QNA5_TALRU|nr:uncharacterized protein TRUGW13939_02540 [Talaromyces rugulosus]QKX55447.1 hypothetical protein TRUGW13939_02540 [Talaromyces rugulosus]
MAATSPYLVAGSFTKVAPHHTSVEALWDIKWRKPCSMGIYPFVDGHVEDFDRRRLTEPYDPDTFAAAFFPIAKELEEKAAQAETTGDVKIASQLYLRVAALYRIARFPIARSSKTSEAWTLGKAAYMKASLYLDPINTELTIPHNHSDASAGDGNIIHAYLRLPPHASAIEKVPVVIFICGLDAYRTDHTSRTSEHIRRGFACLSIEIPGTGDCPAAKDDPTMVKYS